jgi:insertion element IS1 protein InsB
MSFGILLSPKKKLWIWKAYDRNRDRLIDWELGGRDRQTLRKLLDRLAQWQVTVYCTDHWEAYASELEEHPEAHHVETKTETRNIERNNSDHRHWFAGFRRQSKVVSKSKEMVELTMALFAKFRVNGTINSMRDSMLALLT